MSTWAASSRLMLTRAFPDLFVTTQRQFRQPCLAPELQESAPIAPQLGSGHGRADTGRHRRPRRARDAALRVPTPSPRQGADRGPAGRSSDPQVRRGEDGAPRPPRARVVVRRERRARAALAHRLGDDPVVGTGLRPAAQGGMTFEGSSVLVTGGSRGIGKAIALRFASLGASRVAIGYMRGDAPAEETASELRALGAEPILVRGNVASTRVAEEVGALGPLDVLVHAAATGVIRPALETDDKHWDWTLSANARALLSLTRAAAPSMPSA